MKRIHLVALLLVLAATLMGVSIKRGPSGSLPNSGPITIGTSNTTSITFVTDSTGDGEIVIPDASISGTEILDATISASDLIADAVAITSRREKEILTTFCGLGPNAGAENYFKPISGSVSTGTDWTIGGAACDANDSTTIGTASEVTAGTGLFARKFKWMHCSFVDGVGGSENDLITFTFYDAESAKKTCTIQLDGTAVTRTCKAKIQSGEAVAAGATITIGLDNTDDNLSGAGNDAWCQLGGIIDN